MDNKLLYAKPEIWGGFECTINRTMDGYSDQLEVIGHYTHEGDLEEACSLGFKKFRYPILWERHYPAKEKKEAWERTGNQLDILRKHNIEVIAGLLHHGSGPPDTDLMDLSFPQKLASYAKQVATRFPWIKYYTPVNEPLTTARFSGLYGIWYPHLKDDASFARMLINQLKGIVLSMQAIRLVNPDAILVQTEDLSKTHSTPVLSYQARFENERRWFTYDFLTGKVDHTHFAWRYFTDLGIEEIELQFFLDNVCSPGIAGFNYYVTSERYLDENLDNYKENCQGTNGIHVYCDTEAVRTGHMQGARTLLTEAWWRYKLPMALTECQLACTREQQMRWFYQHVEMGDKLIAQGIPVVAITSWGLLGATDWDSLLSRRDGRYETGVFDCSESGVRATALVPLITALAKGENYFHPALNGRGWWELERPLAFDAQPAKNCSSKKHLLVLPGNKPLDKMVGRICRERLLEFTVSGDDLISLIKAGQLADSIQIHRFWAVLYTSGPKEDRTGIDLSEEFSLPDAISLLCKQYGIPFLHLTTTEDMVDGHIDFSTTADVHHGINGTYPVYEDETIIEDEEMSMIASGPCAISCKDEQEFSGELLDSIKNGDPIFINEDAGYASSIHAAALINLCIDLLIDESAGKVKIQQ